MINKDIEKYEQKKSNPLVSKKANNVQTKEISNNKLKEEVFFGYLSLKWRRLLRTIFRAPLAILFLFLLINFFTVQIQRSYGTDSVPYFGSDEIYNGYWENGQRIQLMYPYGQKCSFCVNKIASWFFYHQPFLDSYWNSRRKYHIFKLEGSLSPFQLLAYAAPFYILSVIFLSWSFSKSGKKCKYAPVGFIVWLIEPFIKSK